MRTHLLALIRPSHSLRGTYIYLKTRLLPTHTHLQTLSLLLKESAFLSFIKLKLFIYKSIFRLLKKFWEGGGGVLGIKLTKKGFQKCVGIPPNIIYSPMPGRQFNDTTESRPQNSFGDFRVPERGALCPSGRVERKGQKRDLVNRD